MMEHLTAAFNSTGKLPRRLAEAKQLPDGLETLWSDFLDLHSSRGSTGFGPAPISFVDIDAWQRVSGVRLRPWQIEAVRAADRAYLASLPKPKDRGQ